MSEDRTREAFGSWSCNFTCPWCQNHTISKSPERIGTGRYVSPEELVRLAKRSYCQSTSVSFNEPTLLLEYSLDLFDVSRQQGLYNTVVSNGYMTTKALQLLAEHGLHVGRFMSLLVILSFRRICSRCRLIVAVDTPLSELFPWFLIRSESYCRW